MRDIQLALSDVARCWPALQPPNRIRVSEGAQQSLMIKRPGGAAGYWDPLETAYMVEPMDLLASRIHSAICFVGPAQSGKTVAFGEGWLAHNVLNDPGDMVIFQMTQDKAREYSKQRIDRAIKNSPRLWAMRSRNDRDDTIHDKWFRNGMQCKIAWPTVTNMSSSSYRFAFGTDYDRWNGGKDDVDGEGDGFTLMGKRTTTFLSRGKTAVESSPGRPIVDPTWTPATPHEAPPVGTEDTGAGILGVYNRGDRRRLYWKCPHCGWWFEAKPGLGLFQLPSDDELLESIRELDIDKFARQYARVICPISGCVISFERREEMNRSILKGRGGWLAEGLQADDLDRVSGNPRTSSIASYWLGGVAATYVKWPTLLQKHLQALLQYEMTGSELELQSTANTDQCVPYMSRVLAAAAEKGKRERQASTHERFIVPADARYVKVAVAVQGGKNARFEVQVHAVGPQREEWLINRFSLKKSKREGMGEEFAPIDPGGHAEDWDVLTDLLRATWRTAMPDREIRVRAMMVDTGGEDGVTRNAEAWYRRLRADPETRRLAKRLYLSKGHGTKDITWYVKETKFGGEKGRGDVPLWLLNTNLLKDMVSTRLQRRTPGPGFYYFPEPKHPVKNPEGWLPQSFFDEFQAEVRNEDGKWEQIKPRNESLDLCAMHCAMDMILKTDKKGFWDNPPSWARPLEENSDVISPEQRRTEQAVAAPSPAPAPRQEQPLRPAYERRRRASGYLG